MKFVNYSIPFLFTFCTESQLFWHRVCISVHNLNTSTPSQITPEQIFPMGNTLSSSYRSNKPGQPSKPVRAILSKADIVRG